MNLFMFIMQGLPGSGKSYHARSISREADAVIVSADNYSGLYGRDANGAVTFDVTKLGDAHGACLRGAVNALRTGMSVVVDNTNTDPIEMAPYVALAQAYGAAPKIIKVLCDADKAFARNTHGVPREAFDAMIARLDAFEAPPHWNYIPGFEWRVIRND